LTSSSDGSTSDWRVSVKQQGSRKETKFTALLDHMTGALLRDGFYALKRKAAPSVDGTTWDE
jgi:hypothetical protein